ncbi:hypothetical protein C0J52_14409 [Blattella germanica]|nr:hypothetical protein C0J52_14409 [Blattella germanica]
MSTMEEQWTVQHHVFGHETFLRNNESSVRTQQIYAMVHALQRGIPLAQIDPSLKDLEQCSGRNLSSGEQVHDLLNELQDFAKTFRHVPHTVSQLFRNGIKWGLLQTKIKPKEVNFDKTLSTEESRGGLGGGSDEFWALLVPSTLGIFPEPVQLVLGFIAAPELLCFFTCCTGNRENEQWLTNHFLNENNETRGGALTNEQRMKIFLRYLSDPGFQSGVAEDIRLKRLAIGIEFNGLMTISTELTF